MAAPVWTTDLVDLWVGGAITNWDAIGGGPAGLQQETDFYIEEPDCLSKDAWAGANRGAIYDNGGSFTVDSDGAIIVWGFYGVATALVAKADGGFQIVVGSGVGDYKEYKVGGNDTMLYDTWVPYAIDPNDSDLEDSSTGAPTATEQFAGGLANVSVDGPTKGAPFALDALRYGRCLLEYTLGDSGDPSTFAGAEAVSNDSDTYWGLLEFEAGSYRMQGFHRFGGDSDAVFFVDANQTMFWRSVEKVQPQFNRIEIVDSDSYVQWDNVVFKSLSVQSPGDLVVTAGQLMADACQFVGMRDFTFTSTSVVTSSIFRSCRTIVAPDTLMAGTQILTSTVDSDASALIWNDSDNCDSDLAGMSFSQGITNHHAIEFGVDAPTDLTLREIDFTGFAAADDADGSALYIANTDSDVTITINLVGCTGNIYYKSAGAEVSLVIDPVTLRVTTKDADTLTTIAGARVLVYVADSDNFPWLDSVSMVLDTDTVIVIHADHGLATGEKVLIAGAVETAYNGVHQITVTDASTYTYVIAETPSSPATGSPTSTFVLIDGDTNGSGVIEDTRSYSSSQAIAGRARKSSGSPYYKTSAVPGTIDSSSGLSIDVLLISDE